MNLVTVYRPPGVAVDVRDLAAPADTTPPDTLISSGPADGTATDATFVFSGTDDSGGALTFEASLDGGAFAPVVSPVALTGLAVGSHDWTVRAKDAAGNVDPTPPSWSWAIAPAQGIAVRPSFAITSPAPGRYSGLLNVTFSNPKNAADGPADLYVDGVVRASGTILGGAFTLDTRQLSNEPHSLHVMATPVGGMLGESPSVTIYPNNPGMDPPADVLPPAPYPNSPYLYFYVPNTGTANQSYERFELGPFIFKGTAVPVVVRLQYGGGSQAPLTEPVQLLVDKQPFGPWVTPIANAASFVVDSTLIPKGSHALSARMQTSQRWCEPALIEVNQDGIPLTGPRDVWATPVWFDEEYSIDSFIDAQGRLLTTGLPPFKVKYPGVEPQFAGDAITFPLRTKTPWSTYLPPSSLWAEAISICVPTGWPRRFAVTPEGHASTDDDMQYPHASMESTTMPIFDGQRGYGGFGHVWAFWTNPITYGVFFVVTQGRVGYSHLNARITTIAGKRKPLNTTADRAGYELIGNFVDLPRGFNEPWGGDHDPRDNADPTDWKVHLICDSWNDRISKVDIATARMPGGEATITTEVGKAGPGQVDGPAATAKTLNPWYGRTHPSQDSYWWSEYDAPLSGFRRLDAATGIVTTPWRSNVASPTRVGKPANRVIPALVNGAIIKGIDGPLSSATAYYIQAFDFDSKGRLIFVEKFTGQGGGTVRRIDFVANTMTTLYVVPFDANTRDLVIAVNRDGTCGAIDTIYGTCWGRTFVLTPNADDTYSFRGELLRDEADGTWRAAVLEGQGNQVVGLSYPTAIDCKSGQISVAGTGAECAYRISKKLPTDPVLNFSKQQSGASLYRATWGMRHGIRGQDTLEGNGFAQVRQLPPADRAALYRSGWSLGYAVQLSDAQISDLDYFICWPKV